MHAANNSAAVELLSTDEIVRFITARLRSKVNAEPLIQAYLDTNDFIANTERAVSLERVINQLSKSRTLSAEDRQLLAQIYALHTVYLQTCTSLCR